MNKKLVGLKCYEIVPLIFLFLYVFVVFFSDQFVLSDISKGNIILFSGLFGSLSLCMCLFLYLRIHKGAIRLNKLQSILFKEQKITVAEILCLYLISMGVFSFFLFLEYPGGFSYDCREQFGQVLSGTYSNWHPVIHTLLIYTIPIKLGGGLGVILFLQLTYLSLSLTYLYYCMRKNGARRITILYLYIYIWINPWIEGIFFYPWKDNALSICLIALFGAYIQIVSSKGEWLKKTRNLIFFSIITVLSALMRHNAILFVLPFMLIVIFYYLKEWKIRIKLISLVALLFVSIQVLYAGLGVIKPDRRTLETVGLPATIWMNVMKENPSSLPIDTQEVMYQIASDGMLQGHFYAGNFNSIKSFPSVNVEVIDKMSYKEVLQYTTQCFINAPKESFKSLILLTCDVWGVVGRYSLKFPEIINNTYGIEPHNDPTRNTILESYRYAFFNSSRVFKIIFGSLGLINLLLVSLGLFLITQKSKAGLHAIPFIIYNFGTMLLLSSVYDHRFFIFNHYLFFPCVFVMLKDYKEQLELTSSRRRKTA